MKIFKHDVDLPGYSAADIWPALMELLHTPERYLAGCDRSAVREVMAEGTLIRLIRKKYFGSSQLEDEVVFTPCQMVEILVAVGPRWPRSAQVIAIQARKSGCRLVFSYEQNVLKDPMTGIYAELRNKAYMQKDLLFVGLLKKRLQHDSDSVQERQ